MKRPPWSPSRRCDATSERSAARLGAEGPLVSVPQSHPPGAEAEVDFGEATVIMAGAPVQVSIFHLRLSHSGAAVHVAFASEGQEALLEGHAIAFERLGGVPARIRYDNLKAAVARILTGRDRIEADRFVALRSHYGFDSFFCEPGEGGAHEKGGVEGEVGRFRRRHLVPVPRVANLAELNTLLAAADRTDATRHIDRRLETVGQAAAAERPHLRRLSVEPFDASVALRPKVDRKARVWVRGSHYSVPARLAGRRVDVALGARILTVHDGGRIVARHDRSLHKGAQSDWTSSRIRLLRRNCEPPGVVRAMHRASRQRVHYLEEGAL